MFIVYWRCKKGRSKRSRAYYWTADTWMADPYFLLFKGTEQVWMVPGTEECDD